MTITVSPEMIGWYLVFGSQPVRYPVANLWPATYLHYAQLDFNQADGQRSWVNAVSNAKRALHYQVEALAVAFGSRRIGLRDSFPKKLDFLGSCGVISPTIIRRINRLRNRIEHDYHLPTEDEALEYLEIVELYLGATHFTATYFPGYVEAELIDDDEEYQESWNFPKVLKIHLTEGEGKLAIDANGARIFSAEVGTPEYFEWVAAIVRQNAS
ncbi:hypothetical protein [Frateuria sp. Soil773]|uniref:hypothetical protein n=1 Tax=Frateuria sp. Soil773 TaxID=1736407 RepID=UPI0012FA3B4E|nr:hypothetical protein [Frateuria sp. Soil773]